MKQLLAAALLSCGCAMTWAQTANELINNGKNPEHVLNSGNM